jgi:hypothetical protein
MAVMGLGSKMTFWKIYMNHIDITDIAGSFISSITVTDSILPLPKKSKKDHAPSEASFSITSKNYIEDFFLEGSTVEIDMGYNRIFQPRVFSGKIVKLPDGNARDMLHYTVKAFSNEVELGYKEKIRVFQIPKKSAIIAQIAAENGFTPNIKISKDMTIPPDFMPAQRARTDLEFLVDMAYLWDCVCWFSFPNTLNFVDSDKAHLQGDLSAKDSVMNLILGYRTDQAECNVETISWKHTPPRAVEGTTGGLRGYTEKGLTKGYKEFKILHKQNTFEMREAYRKQATVSGGNFLKYGGLVFANMFTDREYGLREYFVLRHYNDGLHKDTEPAHDGSGMEIEIHLNEGIPTLKPPRNALLFAGSMNPRADSSFLPAWLFRNSKILKGPAKLKINKTTLKYEQGMLRTELKCTMAVQNE